MSGEAELPAQLAGAHPDTPVMMYCTGGIRCDIYSTYLRAKVGPPPALRCPLGAHPDTPVMMYCTGGIRCDIYSTYLRAKVGRSRF